MVFFLFDSAPIQSENQPAEATEVNILHTFRLIFIQKKLLHADT